MVLGEVTLPHPTAHARLAAHEMTARALPRPSSGPVSRWWRVAPRRAPGSARRSSRWPPSLALAGSAGCTSTPTSRPASRCRSHEAREPSRRDRRAGQRARTRDRAARRDLLPRPEPASTWPRSRPRSAGTTGSSSTPRPGRERVEKRYMLVPTTCFNCESACGLLAYVDRETGEVRKFEGNPEHPGSRGRNCAKGPATLNQVTDPDRILYPAEAGRRARRGAVGAGDLGRGARRHRRPDPQGDRRGRARTRSCTTSAGPARTASPSGCSPPGASTATTRTPTSARRAPAPATSSGRGIDRPSPDHANAKVILLISAHLEAGHYFNPHAQRIMEAKAARRQARSSSTPGCRTPPPTPTSGWRRSPAPRRRSCWRSPTT